MLSDYEVERQRNIAANQRVLISLGLVAPAQDAPLPRLTETPTSKRPATYQKKVWVKSKARASSLRRRAKGSIRTTNRRECFAKALGKLMRNGIKDVDDATWLYERVTVTKAKEVSEGGGQRGGWNAGPYVGTALVHDEKDAKFRRVAIRERADGRLYGYVHRSKQICFRLEAQEFPTYICGVKVVCYTHGSKAQESEDDTPKRPRGRAPSGKAWDYENGGWVDEE